MSTAENTTFKVGMASPANTFLAIWVADAAGLYTGNGLNLEIVDMVGGSETGPALTEGRVDLMHIGLSSVVRAKGLGFDVCAIGSLSNLIRGALFAAPGVETAEDLKGGTIGISSVGSESDPTTTLALGKLGLSRDDVSIVEIGVERLSAVREGRVSASMLGEPYRSTALGLGMTPLVDLLAENIPWLYSGLVVHRRTIAEDRDSLLRFMRATVEANYLAVSDAATAKQVLADVFGLTDQAVIDVAYENFKAGTPLDADPSHDGTRNIIDTVAAPDAPQEVADYVDDSIHTALREEGFFAAMAEKYGRS